MNKKQVDEILDIFILGAARIADLLTKSETKQEIKSWLEEPKTEPDDLFQEILDIWNSTNDSTFAAELRDYCDETKKPKQEQIVLSTESLDSLNKELAWADEDHEERVEKIREIVRGMERKAAEESVLAESWNYVSKKELINLFDEIEELLYEELSGVDFQSEVRTLIERVHKPAFNKIESLARDLRSEIEGPMSGFGDRRHK